MVSPPYLNFSEETFLPSEHRDSKPERFSVRYSDSVSPQNLNFFFNSLDDYNNQSSMGTSDLSYFIIHSEHATQDQWDVRVCLVTT